VDGSDVARRPRSGRCHASLLPSHLSAFTGRRPRSGRLLHRRGARGQGAERRRGAHTLRARWPRSPRLRRSTRNRTCHDQALTFRHGSHNVGQNLPESTLSDDDREIRREERPQIRQETSTRGQLGVAGGVRLPGDAERRTQLVIPAVSAPYRTRSSCCAAASPASAARKARCAPSTSSPRALLPRWTPPRRSHARARSLASLTWMRPSFRRRAFRRRGTPPPPPPPRPLNLRAGRASAASPRRSPRRMRSRCARTLASS